MSIITLTTDYGYKDHFVGALKGSIISAIPNVRIIDISHFISPFSSFEAGYILKKSFHFFPQKTIHFIGVEAETPTTMAHLVMEFNFHYFICANNGILSLLYDNEDEKKIVEVNINSEKNEEMPILDRFIKSAAKLVKGANILDLGEKVETIKELKFPQPVISANQIIGSIKYIDNFGNLVTNISKKIFQENYKSRDFHISARGIIFDKIAKSYGDTYFYNENENSKVGEKVALFNQSGYLELAIYKSSPSSSGGANDLYGLGFGNPVIIKFK